MWTRDAIGEIYRKHGFTVLRRCRRLLGDGAAAEDACHEVFLKCLEKPEQFQGRSSVTTFLYSVATHVCLNRIRNAGARGDDWQARVAAQIETEKPGAVPDVPLESREAVGGILADADDTTAMIALLHYVDGLTQGEIASVVGLSRVTVNQRLQAFVEHARGKRAGAA